MIKTREIFFALLMLVYFSASSNSAITDSVVGTVGNKALTQSDIINEMKILLIISGQNLSEEKKIKLRSAAIKSITNRLIKEIEIEKYNYNDFSEEDRIKEINKIAEKLNIDVDNLKNRFKANAVNFSHLINKIETELKWNGLIFYIYKNRIDVNLSEINDQLKLFENKKFINEYLVYEILIESANEDKLQAKISMIKNEIQVSGFEETAIKYSKSPSALNGGKLGWLKETEISKQFREILKNTNAGSITEPVMLPEGILFLKLANKRKIETEIDLENIKKMLLNSEKEKKLQMYSLSHFNKLKQSMLINYNFK